MNVQFKSTRQGEWGKEARSSGVRNEGDEGPGINADLAQMKDTECHPLEVIVLTNEKPEHNDTDQSEAPSPWSRSGLFTWLTPGTWGWRDFLDSSWLLAPGLLSVTEVTQETSPLPWPCLTRNTQRRSLCKSPHIVTVYHHLPVFVILQSNIILFSCSCPSQQIKVRNKNNRNLQSTLSSIWSMFINKSNASSFNICLFIIPALSLQHL